jgi:phosphate transport system substrate-binding protein
MAGVLALGLVAALAAPSGAIPPNNGQAEVLNSVGSDTAYYIQNELAHLWNADSTINTAPKDIAYTTPPRLVAPFPTSYHVGGDSHCAAISYPPSVPPDGSSAGISALVADTHGCVDMARSSRARKSTDPANIQFFAYALDALTWTYFPGSHAPASHNLTQQQLINIYTCNATTGLPFVSNWSQVGGTAGTIIKFAPQTSSGTYAFFNSKILNGAVIDQNCNSSHLSHFVEEHDNTSITAAQKPFAINAYSYAQWTAMHNGVIPDRRNGGALGAINGIVPSLTTIRVVSPHFLGTRYIYNVLKTTEPSYNATLRFAGVDATGPGFICKSSVAIRAQIRRFGDVNLVSGVTGPGLPASFCRLEPTPL